MRQQVETFLQHRKRRSGFTLIEIIIVFAILMVIVALLIPAVWRRLEKSKGGQAELKIQAFDAALREYNMDTGTYPLTTQGLDALINRPTQAITNPTQTQPPGQPTLPTNINGTSPAGTPMDNTLPSGMPAMQTPRGYMAPQGMGGTPGMMNDPGMMGGTPGMMNDPGMMGGTPGMMGDSGMMGGTPGMMNDPGMMSGTPGMMNDPGMMSGTPGMMSDPSMTGGTPGMMGGTPNNNNAARQAYLAQRAIAKWDGPYLEGAIIPQDPWGQDYHYEYPTNRTADGTPAVWSCGPDKVSDTADDIRNYDPAAVELQRQQKMQNSQGQGWYGQPDMSTGGMGTGMPTDGGMGMGTGGMGMGTGMPTNGGMGMGTGGMGMGGTPMNTPY